MPWVSDGNPEALDAPDSAKQEAYAQTPSSFSQGFIARGQTAVAQGIQSLSRVASEGQYEGADPMQRALYSTLTQDEYGQPLDPSAPAPGSVQTPTLSPEEQKQYLPPGQTLGDKPLPQGIVKIAAQAKWDQAQRDQIINRDPSSFPVRFASGMVASLADPLNDAVMLMPGVGEEKLLATFGKEAFLARTAARTIAGGTTGALTQVPLSALRGIASAQDLNDYSMRDAAQDMITSAAMVAFFHAGIAGPIGDALGRSMDRLAEPQVSADAMKTNLAQAMDGRPLDVQSVFDAHDINYRVAQENRFAVIQAQARAMTDEARSMYDEAGRVGMVDPGTQVRLDAIDDELTRPGVIDPARQDELMSERTMLTEGGQPRSELDLARDEAQRQGLQLAADRKFATAYDLYKSVADQQRVLREGGYAQGMPVKDFAAAKERIYGAPVEGEGQQGASKPEQPAAPPKKAAAAEVSKAAAEQPAAEQGTPIGFTTAMGSTYELHNDGTTTRNKASRDTPGHEGDSGTKPRSAKTVYIEPNKGLGHDASALSAAGVIAPEPTEWRVVLKDGKASLVSRPQGRGQWGRAPSAANIPIHESPAIGRQPLELWGPKDDVGSGYEAYSGMHAGNAITEMRTAPPEGAAGPTIPGVAPKPGPSVATAIANPEIAQAERDLATSGPISPATQKILDEARAPLDEFNAREDAYHEAVACLAENA